LMFMAPEMYELAHGNEPPEWFHPKKTDVYSCGLICFAVLIGEPTPFPPKELMNPSVKAFQDGVQKGKRPQLPADSPNHLSSLIQQCWDGNPVKRPNFNNICTELRCIKGLLLTGTFFHHCTLHNQLNSVLLVTVALIPLCMQWKCSDLLTDYLLVISLR
jgi:serine/threonine protein kinase